MAEIVNLRQARKHRQRAEKEQQAAANRAKFGRTKAEKQRIDAEASLDRQRLDRLKLTGDDIEQE